MIIYNADGTTLLDLVVDDSSYSYAEVMNREDVTLEFSLAEYVDIPTGSYITLDGKTYWLLRPAAVTVVNRRNFGYTAVFETDIGKLALWRIKNPADGHVKFPLTAKPSQHLALFVSNLNDHEGSELWQIASGSYDEKEITLSYNRTTIREGLQQLANACETEWEVYRDGGYIYISLGKVEYNASSPLSLSYGENGGFESGVKRTNTGGGLPIEVLYVQGGDKNIDPSTYYEKSSTLLLPRGATNSQYSFSFDGEHFDGETGYDSSKAIAMVTDAHGYSVRLASATRAAAEETLDLSDFYPKRVGTVGAVTTESSDGDYPFYNIDDNDLGTATGKIGIDFNDYLIEGSQFTIIFQSGMLIGREIGVSGFTLGANKGTFKLCQEQIDGFIMPGESGFVPAVGDKYAVFGCSLPAEYLRDYSTHTGAEFDMLRKAAKYLYENCKAKQTFKGTLAKVYARKNWSTIGPKIVLGGYVSFTDADVQDDPVLMRIMSVKRPINNPYKPEIELSNEATKGTVGGSIQTLTNNQARTEREFYNTRGFTNRRFRDAMEAISMLEGTIEGYSEGITPITVQTMSALVGDNSLQYEFTNSTYATIVDNSPYFDNSGNLVCGAGYIKHFTLGFSDSDYVKSNRPASEYYRWTITAATFAFTDERPKYLYIQASKPSSQATVGTATYLLSATSIPFEPTTAGTNYDTSHYYLLFAIVSSEVEGSRSVSTYNGFTEITPGQLRAMKWISNDGYQFIDFINKSFRIGDSSKFLGYNIGANGAYDGLGKLRLKGTIVQSPSGDVFPVACPRGEYDGNTDYFWGDEVTHGGESWLHTGEATTNGVEPGTDDSVWTKSAAKGDDGQPGEDGDAGTNGVAIYQWTQSSDTAPSTPQSLVYPPLATWYASAPSRPGDGYYLWMSTAQLDSTTNTVDAWSTPTRISGDQGTPGEDADGREWIYNYSNTGYDGATGEVNPSGTASGSDTNKSQDGWVPNGWKDSPSGVSTSNKTEYASYRDITVNGTTKTYGAFQTPIVWSHYGERGIDGDGVEYVFIRTSTDTAPSIVATADSYEDSNNHKYTDDEFLPLATGGSLSSNTECTDEPSGVTSTYKYEWVAKRTKAAPNSEGQRTWEKYSGTMSLWAKYGEDGASGANGKASRGPSEFTKSGFNNTGVYMGVQDSQTAAINGNFIDIVSREISGEMRFFQCKVTYQVTSSSANPESDSTHWEEFNNFSLIATKSLYADHIAAKNLTVDNLNTGLSSGASANRVRISGNTVNVENSSGTEIVKISGGDIIGESGGSGTISKSGSYSATSSMGATSLTGTVFSSALSITSPFNSITVSSFSATMTCYDSNNAQVEIDDEVSMLIYLLNSTTGERITLAAFEGYAHNYAGTTQTQMSLSSLSAGSWNIAVEFTFTNITSARKMTCAVSTISLSGSYSTPSSTGTQIGGNGLQSFWGSGGTEGIKVTASGAQVKQGGSLYTMLGGASGLKRIEIITGDYPSTGEDGVLYIKVSSS